IISIISIIISLLHIQPHTKTRVWVAVRVLVSLFPSSFLLAPSSPLRSFASFCLSHFSLFYLFPASDFPRPPPSPFSIPSPFPHLPPPLSPFPCIFASWVSA